MKYLNASQAAKRIGISDKTIRRWLKEGKISAIRTGSNQLAIPENEVEALRRQRAQFVQHEEDHSTTSHDQSLDIRALAAKVAVLEQELATLKGAHINPPEQEPVPSVSTSMSNDVPTREVPQMSPPMRNPGGSPPTDIPAELPPGTVKLIDFIEAHGLLQGSVSRWMKAGIRGEKIETTQIDRPNGPGVQHFFTPAQQEKALDFLRRHGKLKTAQPEPQEKPIASEHPWWSPDGQ